MMLILEIDEGADFESMPQDLKDAISEAGIEWPHCRLTGTGPVLGRELILVDSKISKADLIDRMNTDTFDEEGKQIKFNLGWEVVACEGEPVDQVALLPYFLDVPILDGEGNQIGLQPVTDITGKLQRWAGKKWQY